MNPEVNFYNLVLGLLDILPLRVRDSMLIVGRFSGPPSKGEKGREGGGTLKRIICKCWSEYVIYSLFL